MIVIVKFMSTAVFQSVDNNIIIQWPDLQRGEVEGGIWPTQKFWSGAPYGLCWVMFALF